MIALSARSAEGTPEQCGLQGSEPAAYLNAELRGKRSLLHPHVWGSGLRSRSLSADAEWLGYVRDEKVRALWGQKMVENFSVSELASGHGLQVQDGGGC